MMTNVSDVKVNVMTNSGVSSRQLLVWGELCAILNGNEVNDHDVRLKEV